MTSEKLSDYIPLDKSYTIRMALLDLFYGQTKFINLFMAYPEKDLGDDLMSLKRVLKTWDTDNEIDVGESGTLFRILQYCSWRNGYGKKFIKQGTLRDRQIYSNRDVINMSWTDLQKLDGNTSQWCTARLLSDLASERTFINNIDFLPDKMKLTLETINRWRSAYSPDSKSPVLHLHHDWTLMQQAEWFITRQIGTHATWASKHSEDYCFARMFGYMTTEQGAGLWPQLRHHESNRIDGLEVAIQVMLADKTLYSKDHRVIQAYALAQYERKKPIKVAHPECVKKSWTRFWEFLDNFQNIANRYKKDSEPFHIDLTVHAEQIRRINGWGGIMSPRIVTDDVARGEIQPSGPMYELRPDLYPRVRLTNRPRP